MITFIAIGGSGTGKSTIGNVFLSGGPTGPFTTYAGVDSCTKEATTKTNDTGGRSFTDTPGIPDTNPANTKAFYNKCINALKKDHSAIVFVFNYERIDPAMLKTSKVLFREMKKANCKKFLIINDRNNYEFNSRPDQSEYKRLAEEIKSVTEVSFDLFSDVASPESMKQCLVDFAKESGKPLASPTLKNFDELGKWVNSLKKDKYDLLAALERAEKEKEMLVDDLCCANFCPCLFSSENIEREVNAKKSEISRIHHAKRGKERMIEEAMNEFNELRQVVGA